MDKWAAKRLISESKDKAAAKMAEMSDIIVGMSREIKDTNRELADARLATGCAQASEARLQGYIQRVKEVDSPVVLSVPRRRADDGAKTAAMANVNLHNLGRM